MHIKIICFYYSLCISCCLLFVVLSIVYYLLAMNLKIMGQGMYNKISQLLLALFMLQLGSYCYVSTILLLLWVLSWVFILSEHQYLLMHPDL